MTIFNLIAVVVKRKYKTIAINALIPTLSRPEPHGSMTGTREWEYIKYPKPIVSLDNFSRIKTLTITIIKLHFKYFSFIVAIKNTP